jgi:hypothetical protein
MKRVVELKQVLSSKIGLSAFYELEKVHGTKEEWGSANIV